MPMNKKDRKSLSPPRGKLGKQPLMPQLLQVCRGFFQALEERYPKAEQSQYSLRDCQALFMATFLFKFPSLSSLLTALSKNFRTQESLPGDGVMHRVRANLRELFGLQRAPCDTTARRRLDEVATIDLQGLFAALLGWLECLQWQQFFQLPTGELLLLIDGTQVFHSPSLHCAHCYVKEHRDGTKSWSHQVVVATVVHPQSNRALILGMEPLGRADGRRKNDSEMAAAKRLLRRLREQHPDVNFVVVADALYAKGPMIRLCQQLCMSYLIRVKPGKGQSGLFAYMARRGHAEARWHTPSQIDAAAERNPRDRGTLRYRLLPCQQLNGSHEDLYGTVLQCERRVKTGGSKLLGEWFTNLEVLPSQVAKFVRYARRRWLIENCIFKTLKALNGMNLEHNFGHGQHNLCNNLTVFMLTAALMDQISLIWCDYFQAVRQRSTTAAAQWERQRIHFCDRWVADWTDFFLGMSHGFDPPAKA